MELKEFIADVLDQMKEVKDNENKKNYIVKELEFEISLQKTEDGKVGVAFWGIGGDFRAGEHNTHKVKVTLTPNRNNI